MTEKNTDLILSQAVHEFLESGDAESVRAFLADQHPADIANVLDGLEIKEAVTVLDMLDRARKAQTFGYLDLDQQLEIARGLPRRALAAIISEMESDERVDLFNRLNEEEQEALLPGLARAEREDIRKLASYEEGTAGSVMTSDYAVLTPELTARQAIEKLRREALDKETIYETFVVDKARKLLGTVSLQDLVLAPGEKTVEALMRTDVPFIRADEPREEAARTVARYDLLALPVINGGDALVGIITHDDVLDVIEQEATEDFHKIATVGDITGGVRDAALSVLYRKRVVWLVLLVFANIFAGAGIAYYEETIEAYIALVFFLPLLVDSGGNAGSQSATLMVRALATGDVVMRDWARMLGRELAVATALGATMAVAVSMIGIFRGGPEIAVVVASAMVLIVIVGSLIGMSLPFLLSRMNLDPATASAPLVTSIADVAGVLIYFAIATAILLPGTA